MPGNIPPEAEREILERLSRRMRIRASEVDAILERYGVTGDEAQLQQRYRRQLGQRLLAGLRDEAGRREVLAVRDGQGGTEYLVVDCCAATTWSSSPGSATGWGARRRGWTTPSRR